MENVRVATVQFNHRPGDKLANLAVIDEFVRKVQNEKVEILAFPEMCITGYWHIRHLQKRQIEELAEPVPSGSSSQALLQMSRQSGMVIGAGLIERDEQGRLFNAYLVAMPDGTFACHRKLHCFISEHMCSGDQYTVFDTPCGRRVGVLICWDNNLGENVRMVALGGAEILLAPHQTGGCNSRSPGAMGLIDPELWTNRHLQPELIRAEFQGPKGRGWLMRWLPSRAHDNGLFVLFSNGVGVDDDEVRTGNAMILGAYGEILAESDEIDNDMVIANLDLSMQSLSTGRRWLRGRRPELYGPLCRKSGWEFDPRSARFSRDEFHISKQPERATTRPPRNH